MAGYPSVNYPPEAAFNASGGAGASLVPRQQGCACWVEFPWFDSGSRWSRTWGLSLNGFKWPQYGSICYSKTTGGWLAAG